MGLFKRQTDLNLKRVSHSKKMCQRIDSAFLLFILVAFFPHQLFAESCSDCRPEYGNCCSAENGDYVDPNDPLSGTKCFNQIPYDGLEVTTEGDAVSELIN